MKIKFYWWSDSGDWSAVEVDGALYHEGHDVPSFVWLELLQKLGVEVEEIDVPSNEDGIAPSRYDEVER